jgi:hypothetical protein
MHLRRLVIPLIHTGVAWRALANERRSLKGSGRLELTIVEKSWRCCQSATAQIMASRCSKIALTPAIAGQVEGHLAGCGLRRILRRRARRQARLISFALCGWGSPSRSPYRALDFVAARSRSKARLSGGKLSRLCSHDRNICAASEFPRAPSHRSRASAAGLLGLTLKRRYLRSLKTLLQV